MLYSSHAPASGRLPHGQLSVPARKERPTSTVIFPLGPYHPALPQPLALSLRLRGETIASAEPPVTGFGRRGIADLVAGKSLDDALAIIERACAHAHESHRLVVCQAIESASGLTLSSSARLTRTLFAEIERLLARFWTLGMAARAAGFPAPFQDAMERREILFEALETVTGERVFWAVSIRGGVRPDLDVAPLRDPLAALEQTVAAWRVLAGPKGALGRALRGAGPIAAERAEALGLTGLAARGSRTLPDLRRAAPYAGYADVTVPDAPSPDTLKGDVASRLAVAVDDMGHSLTIALACIEELIAGGVSRAPGAASGKGAGRDGSSAVEGPHGPVAAAVTLAGDTAALAVARVQLDPPGAATLAALPALLEGQPIAQAPVILASLDLCVECLDL